jgi:proteasome lid subunit RPN8/RPN11
MKKTNNHSTNPIKTIEDDLNSLDERDLLKEETKKLSPLSRKIIFGFIGLLIVFLFLSLIYLQYPLFNVIQGQIESRSPNDNVLLLKGFNITFTDEAMNSLQNSFSINQEVETSKCLKGTIQNGNYFITEVYTPKIYDQSFRHVTSEPCSNDTLIMFHTHPYKSCVASTTDLNTLKNTQMNNPDIIMIIMCAPSRFSTYG